MTARPIDHDDARALRTHWFRYLDTIEPMRGELYGYCQRLTRNVWDAEDLVQDTLLTGFGMIGRGDFHGETSPVRNMKAYLFRTATNAWLDLMRKRKRESAAAESDAAHTPIDPVSATDAMDKAFALASPQELAALLLKDVYDFTLEECADFIGTTVGTVKSALHRARQKMRGEEMSYTVDASSKVLVEKFVNAINSQDVERVIALMAENVQISVCNVGGGRGRHGIWTEKSIGGVRATYGECHGVPVVLMFRIGAEHELYDVLRLTGTEAIVTRIVDHCYAPETLRYVAKSTGFDCDAAAYHQPWPIIDSGMVPTTALPWLEA